MTKNAKFGFLSGNSLKLLAALFMLTDHTGLIFFPKCDIFRIIGRLAFPMFAFFVAEGCRYTKNRLKHFLTLFLLALGIQIVYFFAVGQTNMSVFVTFSFSVLLIYILDNIKDLISKKEKTLGIIMLSLLFVLVSVAAALLDKLFIVDYGFIGVMTPVFASLCHTRESSPEQIKKYDTKLISLLCMAIPLILHIIFDEKWYQFFSLLSLPLLYCYSGKRGSLKLKYFFYMFYPAHLVILYGINYLIYIMT